MPSQSYEPQKLYETKWALMLLRSLNSKGYDYEIADIDDIDIPPDWADVDVCAKSSTNKYPPLYIQLCLDVEPRNEGYERFKELPGRVYTFNNCDNPLGAIEGKIKKYINQKKDFSKIILAIQSIGSYFIDGDEKLIIRPLREKSEELKKNYENMFFKNIYLLSQRGEVCDGQNIQEDPERVFKIF